MATTKTKKKGKTMALTDFLAGDSKLVTVRGTNWSEIVDSEEAESKPVVVDIGGLPTAPRAATDIDYSTILNEPPFIAHVANLSFEIDDEKLRRIFGDLNPTAARIIKEGSRSRGIGLVEFPTRESLIEALKRHDREVYGRKIRVNVSDKPDLYQTDSGRGGFGGQRSHRAGAGEERSELSGTWRRAEPRSDDTTDERSTGGFNRDRQNRNDNGRSNMGNGPRDNKHSSDYGFGYPRGKDDRAGGAGGGRDYNNRQGHRNHHQHDDDNRSNNVVDRPRYGGRYSDTRDTRERNRPNDETRDDQAEPPRERQRLQLQPRTKPLEEFQQLSGSSSSVNNVAANARQSNPDEPSSSLTQQDSINTENQHEDFQEGEQTTAKSVRGAGASIFGGAKPVDTTAREAEIEKKMKELALTSNEASGETEEKKAPVQRHSYNRTGDRDNYRSKRPSNDDDARSGHGGEYHHRREYSGGRQFEDEGRRRNEDDHHHPRRGTNNRYNNPNRRDQDSNRSNKYNQSDRDNERGNFRNRNQNNEDRSSNNNNFNSDSQLRHPTRVISRRTLQTDDDSNRLQLSNKFGMLDDDENLDDENESENVQSPSIDE